MTAAPTPTAVQKTGRIVTACGFAATNSMDTPTWAPTHSASSRASPTFHDGTREALNAITKGASE